MDFKLEFNMDNDAFRFYPESTAAQMLRDMADQIESGLVFNTIRDINGNTIGKWEFTD